MKTMRNLIFAVALIAFAFSTAMADSSALVRALDQMNSLGVIPAKNFPQCPDRLVEMMKNNGRLEELGLTEEEGRIYAEEGLIKMGIRPNCGFWSGKIAAGPTAPHRTPAEFQPQAGVLIYYPFGYGSITVTFDEMLKALDGDEDLTVYLLVQNATAENVVKNALAGKGIAGENFQYFHIATESVWTRDYGPIFLEENFETETSTQSAIDMKYFYATDDLVVDQFGTAMDIPTYDMPINFEGGNFMSDGAGTCFTSTGIFNENYGLTESEADALAAEYWGCEKYYRIKTIIGEATTHIDMYAKLLDANTVLVNEVESDDENYARLEEIVTMFESATNVKGEPFEVIRMPMPEMYTYTDPIYGTTRVYRSYTNSVILNDKCLVPIYNIPMDAEGLAVYENYYNSKGMEVIPIDSEAIIEWLGAVHCVTMEHSAYGWSMHSSPEDDDDDDDSADDDDDDDDTGSGDDDDDDDDNDDDGCGC